jgi:hypothetical protein
MRKLPFSKLAGLGAFAAAGGILALFALLVYITIPRPSTGGIDWPNALLTWISVGLIVLALLVPHLIYGRILLQEARQGR